MYDKLEIWIRCRMDYGDDSLRDVIAVVSTGRRLCLVSRLISSRLVFCG